MQVVRGYTSRNLHALYGQPYTINIEVTILSIWTFGSQKILHCCNIFGN